MSKIKGSKLFAIGASAIAVAMAYKSRSARVMNSDKSIIVRVYKPGSPEQILLFEKAADLALAPRGWAASSGLINILDRESGGRVGVPNYTYGERYEDESRWPEVWGELKKGIKTAKSSASGLGQLILANVDECYPDGREGIGNALNEAAGMLCYIKQRYGNPEKAWALYGKGHEGY